MAVPLVVYMSQQSAYQRIIDEAHRSPMAETGGILVGRMFVISAGLVLVVVGASGPGAHADHQWNTYAPDTTTHQSFLHIWWRRYAAYHVDYVGEWHTHPAGANHPSHGDTVQVRQILHDPDYVLPHGMFTPIVTREYTTWTLHGFFYPRATMLPSPVEVEYRYPDQDIEEQLLPYLVAVERESIAARTMM